MAEPDERWEALLSTRVAGRYSVHAICARAICEAEGRNWLAGGQENSREDCERWFTLGRACETAIFAALSEKE